MEEELVSGSVMCDCGHMESPHYKITRGYATDRETGKTLCYDCVFTEDKARLLRESVFAGYLSSDGKHLINWVGRRLGEVTRVGKDHPWSRRSFDGPRYYVRVRDCHGQDWYGTGAPGMYTSLRKTKQAKKEGA